MFCIWWPAGFMVARLVVNNMLWAVMEHSGVGSRWGVSSSKRANVHNRWWNAEGT